MNKKVHETGEWMFAMIDNKIYYFKLEDGKAYHLMRVGFDDGGLSFVEMSIFGMEEPAIINLSILPIWAPLNLEVVKEIENKLEKIYNGEDKKNIEIATEAQLRAKEAVMKSGKFFVVK
jgi:hypothetical protein